MSQKSSGFIDLYGVFEELTTAESLISYDDMKIDDTLIKIGGVFRCCIDSLADDYQREVSLNDKAECKHCHTSFTLVPNSNEKNSPFVWVPDWQLEQQAAEVKKTTEA